MSIPARSKRTVNIHAEFLVDKPEYVLGVNQKRPDDPKTSERRAAFLGSMQNARLATGDEFAGAAVRFLDTPPAIEACVDALKPLKFLDNDLVTFTIGGEYLHDRPLLRAYWQSKYGPGAEDGGRQCLLCGQVRPPVELHPNVKGLRGASTSGVPMVSFNTDAFESYGWDGNQNAPVCQECAASYVTAINRLLSDRTPDPDTPGTFLNRQSRILGEDQTALYWCDSPGTGTEDLFAQLHSSPAEVDKLLSTPFTAERAGRFRGRFHMLVLQGATGRATVRSYHTETVRQVWEHVRLWQEQTAVRPGRPVSILEMLRSLAVKGEADKLPKSVSQDLYLAAVFGAPLTSSLFASAVTRCRVSAQERVPAGRAALIAVSLARQRNRSRLTEGSALVNQSDVSHATPAYQLGRLLAVCEWVQRAERPGASATITDRFYAGLSTRPASFFGQLMKLNRSHLARMKSRKGLQITLERRVGELVAELPPLPATFDLVQQGEFALGYYHEKWSARPGAKDQPGEDQGEME